jgi:WXG100 family type VII secretion target
MAQINANPSELERIARNLRTLTGETRDMKNNLNSAKGTVQSAWKSQYTGQYIEEVDTVYRNVTKLEQKIESLASSLVKEAGRIRKIEEDNKKTFCS